MNSVITSIYLIVVKMAIISLTLTVSNYNNTKTVYQLRTLHRSLLGCEIKNSINVLSSIPTTKIRLNSDEMMNIF